MRAANSVDEAPRRHEPGDRVGPWIIGERVGGGGFGDVYAATHHASRMPAALKVLHAHFVASSEMLARFDREVEVLSRLRHPNVVRVIDAGFDDSGRPYFAMERLVGRDLGTILAARQRLGTAEVRRIIEPLCETLAFAHELGIVHRDLKASNVFVCDADQRVVLLDFGIAKLSDALMPELTASHQSLGTPGCMAPEQIHGGRVDARTDIYALGGLLFLLLTGRMPFSDPSETMTQYLHMHARRPRASALVPVPAEVDDVIVRAMAIQPGDRYAEARALLEAVRSALREAPQPIATTVEHSAIFLWIDNLGDDDELDEGLIADLERVLPAVERQLGEQGFALALDLGTSALFLAPGREPASAVRTAVAVWDALESRAGRDPRVRVGLCVHRGVATVTGHRIEPCALLRPETWGMPEQLVGVWVTNAIEPALRRVR
ncbi:MAG: serine/threonine-protein kinase [Kofleriaceae bacterium]